MIFAVFAQIKFVATYMVPSLYPSLLIVAAFLAAAFHMPLATFSAPPPGSEWPFVLNAIAWLGVITILATLALTLKKLFGRQPSLTEILSGLVSRKYFDDYKSEQHLRDRGLEEQISAARHSFDERANSDLKRNLETFKEIFERNDDRDKTVAMLRDSMSAMQERTQTHIRNFDSLFTKCDTLLREVSRSRRDE